MGQVEILIDTSQLTVLDSLLPAFNMAVEAAVSTSLIVIRDKWQQEAQRKLKSTLSDYLLGLDFDSVVYPYEGDPMTGMVILRGDLPNALEKGYTPFDMKKGFSNSNKKVATKGGGWVLTIPIRHSTPGSHMYGQPMSAVIYEQAKKLPHWGSLSVKGGEGASWTGYQHKANIHDQLTRIKKQYASGKKQSQYFTFRRVGSKSDPASWWHPGFDGVHIAESLKGFAASTVQGIVEANIRQVLQGSGQ